MPYTNTIVTTSTSQPWNNVTGLFYSTISLIDGIPHSAQLEVERVFTVPRSTGTYATIEDFLNNSATTQKDKQQVFIIPASRITFNETDKKITAIDLPSTGNTYDYDPDGVGLANVPVPAIAVGDTLKVRRKTVSNQSLVEWTAGSKLTSSQLNLEVKQLLYLIQELVDKTTTEVTVSNTAIGTIPNYSIVPTKLSVGSPIWNSSSFVGIGMTPTTRTLSVYQASYPTIQIVNSTTGSLAGDGGIIYMSGNDMLVTNQESANLKLETNNTTRLTISSSGDVGIGTTTPITKLQIAVPSTGTTLTGSAKYGGIHLTQTNNVNDEFAGITTSGISTGTIGGILFQSANTYGIKMHFLTTDVFNDGMKNRMTLDHLGNLGIGTTSPSQKLHVYGGTIRADNTTGSSGDVSLIGTGGPSGSGSNLQVLHETGNSLVLLNSGSPGGNFSFRGSGGTSMRITSDGNVGIGTTSPTGKLHVVGNTKVTSGTAGGVQSDITNMSGIHLDGNISNSSTSSILYSSGGGGGAAISFYRNAAYQTGIVLSTNAASSAYTTTERMRIDPNGNVGIGIDSPLSKLHIKDGGICYQRSSSSVARVYSNLGIWHYNDTATGIVEIAIPSTGWTDPVSSAALNTMLDITIDGRNYVPSASWTIKISAYLYGSGTQWHSSSAQIIGRCPFSTVRLGYNTTTNKPVILLGETNTSLEYPDIRVSSVATSYGHTESSIFNSEWTIRGLINSTSNYTLNYGGSTPVVAYNLDTSGNATFRGAITTGSTINAGSNISTVSSVQAMTTSAPAAGGVQCITLTSSNIGIIVASASPNGVITAPKGSLCINTGATAANTRLWINTNGGTGWAAVTSG